MSEVRLIDAHALKEYIKNVEDYESAYTICAYIDNALTVETDIEVATKDAYMQGYTDGWKERFGEPNERPQGELKEYKPLEVDYNVKSAVENLKTAYWSNDSEKYAQAFVEADQMIVSAICHYGYIVVKGGAE